MHLHNMQTFSKLADNYVLCENCSKKLSESNVQSLMIDYMEETQFSELIKQFLPAKIIMTH